VALSWEYRLVQGVERVDRELLDAGALVGHLVAEGSMFAFLAAHPEMCSPMGSSRTCSRRAGTAVDPGVGDGVGSGVAGPAWSFRSGDR
jgi:hypothetical protein